MDLCRIRKMSRLRKLQLFVSAVCVIGLCLIWLHPTSGLIALAGALPKPVAGQAGEVELPTKGADAERNLALITAGFQVALCGMLQFLKQRRKEKWEGAHLQTLAPTLLVGWVVRFLLPIPDGVTTQAWSMMSIFVAMIFAVVTGPLEPAGVTVVALATAVFTGTVTWAEGLNAFTDEVVWLVLLAFFFAEGFGKTGLGDRIALTVIRAVGGTTLGLAYGLNAAELLMAAAMPCSAARAAAVFYPITLSVCKTSGSDPAKGTRSKCGAFLVECCYQATATSSCLFLTGAAQNYFVLKLAAGVGIDVPSPFTTWIKAALAPAIVSFLLTPLLAFKLLPPESTSTPDAPEAAKTQLEKMGPMTDSEKVFGAVICCMVGLWATSSSIGIPPVVTALCGLAMLLLTGVMTWEDCAKNKKGWSTFVSFASLVGLAAMLNKLGIVKWVAGVVTAKIQAAGFSQVPAFLVILTAYWGVHYLFASQVAHVSALFQPFLLMLVETGTPPVAAVFALAFASNLFATMTPYASAQSAVMFGGKYITTGEWYKVGFAFAVFYFVTWVTVGAAWWKIIGLI
eukprot:TRINITY_DN80239_c0_g1_i1.p1 TRINITY_DN80239_c0_g1~~TRINITY_DN80239_c0_g1_i1.p1  ORF type:complete len:568 (+),score=106.73 TRINITY_DN80239_c0_g1_i1:68-1771(+)